MKSSNNLINHYNKKYQNTFASETKTVKIASYPKDRFEITAKLAIKNCKGRYLEIGAGSGNVALTVINKYDELILTELSVIRCKELHKLFNNFSKVTIIEHNIDTENLNFPDDFFNTIVMTAVIEHLVDPITALKELNRVLCKGGKLIIDTPNIAKWTRRIKLLLGYFPSTASMDEGLLCYDKKTLTDLL